MSTIAYDCKLRQPGCVLVQAATATITGSTLAQHFDPDDWLLTTTPDMRIYEVTEQQLRRLSTITKNREKQP